VSICVIRGYHLTSAGKMALAATLFLTTVIGAATELRVVSLSPILTELK